MPVAWIVTDVFSSVKVLLESTACIGHVIETYVEGKENVT